MAGGAGKTLKGNAEASIREIVFGLEDSLVSTLGAITGMAASTDSRGLVFLTGVILVIVEAVSMAAGSYLSSKSAKEAFDARLKEDHARILQEKTEQDETIHELLLKKSCSKADVQVILKAFTKERQRWFKEIERLEYRFAPNADGNPLRSGVVMGVFYIVGGVFPLMPYLILEPRQAILPSILFTGLILFGVGSLKGAVVGVRRTKSGLEMMAVSLAAAVIGYLLGTVLSSLVGTM